MMQLFDLIQNVMLWAGAGYGKTHVLQDGLLRKLKAHYGASCVWITGLTSIAALLLGGETLHSVAGVQTAAGSAEELAARIRTKPRVLNRWLTAGILTADEISMLSYELFFKLEHIARILRGNNLFFGGMRLFFVGDLRQLPPCDDRSYHPTMRNSAGRPAVRVVRQEYFFKGPRFVEGGFAMATLTTCWRQQDDADMAELLQLLRNTVVENEPSKRWPERLWELVMKTCSHVPHDSWVTLTARNVDADNINDQKMDALGDVHQQTFCSVDERPGTSVPPHLWTEAEASGAARVAANPDLYEGIVGDSRGSHVLSSVVASKVLRLKVGAQVIANGSVCESVPNGTRGMVIDFRLGAAVRDEDVQGEEGMQRQFNCSVLDRERWWDSMNEGRRYPLVQFDAISVDASGHPQTTRVCVVVRPRKFEVLDQDTGRVIASRLQLPLSRAWSLTVHKSQGLTLRGVVVKLGSPFSYGQVYTAVSRVRRFCDVMFALPVAADWKLASADVHEFEAAQDWVYFDNSGVSQRSNAASEPF
jgi:ATP-dependent DNA helicase PIF1